MTYEPINAINYPGNQANSTPLLMECGGMAGAHPPPGVLLGHLTPVGHLGGRGNSRTRIRDIWPSASAFSLNSKQNNGKCDFLEPDILKPF